MNPSSWFSKASAVLGGVALVFLALPAAAQQAGTVSGTVTEAGTGRPLAGVQIFIAGLDIPAVAAAGRIRTLSDDEGFYALPGTPAGRATVRARLVGYSQQSAEVAVMGGQTVEVNFALNRSVIALDEIVVSGAGGQVQKKQLGNTIATVDVSRIQTAPVQNFSQALQGREPSVVGMPSGGLAGEGTRIRIRGSSSLAMSNEPVVYVDGVRIDNAGGFAGGDVSAGGVGGGSRLDDINPESIERIEILKGAAAATLYGSEASAGVIQIFTKSGASGRPRFSFRIDQQLARSPDRYKPQAGFARDQAQADKLNNLYGGHYADGDRNIVPFEVFEITSVDDMLETGHTQSYSGSVTGGGEDVQYYFATRATFEDGVVGAQELGPAKDFNRRYQGNVAVTLFPRDRIQFRVSGSFTDTHLELPNRANNIFGVLPLAMDSKPEIANCDDSSVDPDRKIGDTTPVCTGAGNATGDVAFMTVRESMQQVTNQDVEHFNASVTTSYEATSSLNLEATFGIDATNDRSFEFAPFGYDVDDFTGNNPDGFRNIGTRNHRELTLDTKIRWNERFAGDQLSSQLVVGGQGFVANTKRSGGEGSVFPGPGLEVAGAAANQSLSEFALEKVNAGVFAQEQFGIRDIVFLTAGARFDRNSAFGENEDAAFYPKASVSIIPSDLAAWDNDLLSTFRVRAAIGQSGLQPGAFDKFTTFAAGATSVGAGLEPFNLGNENLKAEKSTEWEFGTELGLFQNRIGVDFTYWTRTTRDALVARQFPVTGGFVQQQLDNIAELKGSGVELKVDALLLDRDNFTASFFANASYLTEEITSMGAAPPIKVGGSYPRYRNFLMEGFAPGALFGAALVDYTPGQTVPFDADGDGVQDTEAEFVNFLTTTPDVDLDSPSMDPLLRDDDGDGDLLDHFLGKPTPDWTGSFGTQMTLWRNLQINTLFEYKAGNFGISNLTDAFRKSNPSIGRNTRGSAQVEATLKNPATTSQPDDRLAAALDWATKYKSLSPFSGLNLVDDGDYLRWNELSIAYTVPSSVYDRIGLTNLQVVLTGRNLALWTGYAGIDPESNNAARCGGGGEATTDCNFQESIDAWGLPLVRQFGLSVRFGF